jgi:hypothetical protein
MLGSSRVAAQLAASQEGLSSMSDDDDDDDEWICLLEREGGRRGSIGRMWTDSFDWNSLFENVRSWLTSHGFESLKEIFRELLTIFSILFVFISGNFQLTKFVK